MMKPAFVLAVQLSEAIHEGGYAVPVEILKTMEPTMFVDSNSSIRQCCRISSHLQELSLG